MEPIRVETLDDPRVAEFRDVADPVRLRSRGTFVAEGRFAVRRLLATERIPVRALLLTDAARTALKDDLGRRSSVSVYLASRTLIRQIGGYDFHQGCLGLAERPRPLPVSTLLGRLRPGAPVLVLEQVGNADNVGGLFRNAAAFGASAVLLSPGCCDPLYRKSVRTSIAATLEVPFTTLADWPEGLGAVRQRGYRLVALTPHVDAIPLSRFQWPDPPEGVALMLGNEGDGLSADVLAAADARVRIPLHPPIDSLNVATTAAVALCQLDQQLQTVNPDVAPPGI